MRHQMQEDVSQKTTSSERYHGVQRRQVKAGWYSKEDKVGYTGYIKSCQDYACHQCSKQQCGISEYSLEFQAGLSKGNNVANTFFIDVPSTCFVGAPKKFWFYDSRFKH